MVNKNYVLSIGLSEWEEAVLLEALPHAEFQVLTKQPVHSLLHGDYFAAIIRRDFIKPEQEMSLRDFFQKEDGASTTKLFLADESDALINSTNSQLFMDMGALQQEVAGILKKAYDRAKRQQGLTKSISISFFIWEQILSHPGISTAELAQQLGRSEAAVKRYIEELRMAGKEIAYDYGVDGWRYGSSD